MKFAFTVQVPVQTVRLKATSNKVIATALKKLGLKGHCIKVERVER